MRAAKFFSILVLAITGLYGMVGLYFLPLADFEGDLTRVGKLPESLFGWTKTQPAIRPELLRQTSWKEADVLVIGDSFSEPRIWQSVLVQHGVRVRTEHWTSVRGVCEDFYPWVRAQGFKGKIVIFEVVERNIEAGIPNSVACKKLEFHPSVNADKPRHPPSTMRAQADRSGRMSIGMETQLNVMRYNELSARTDFYEWNPPGGARVRRVPNGCELFSHPRCKDALFYVSDRVTDIGKDTLDNIQTLNSRVGDLTPIWVFMPDKSTVFLHPDKQFWNEAERRINAPNVLKTMRNALDNRIVDLYPANNSHLSTTGYLILGDLIYRKIVPMPE